MAARLIGILLLLGICAGCTKGSDSEEVGISKKSSLCEKNSRISNGRSCDNAGSSPVVMLILTDRTGEAFALCSGTMVTPDTVLTAAHCVDPNLGVTGVMVDRDGKKNLVRARQLFMHPLWDSKAGNPYDIGIVRLSSAITNRPTVPILLSRDISIGDSVGIYGYGMDEEENVGRLNEGRMEISGSYNRLIIAEYDRTQMSICPGDSGGPATYSADGFTGIIGINSAGANGCLEGSIAAFADIQLRQNLDFILEHAPGIGTI